MRNILEWSKPIRDALTKSYDLNDYIEETGNTNTMSRLTQLIVDVELGLTLLMEVAPSEGAISVSALLLGYRFPVTALLSDENWRLAQVARFYLFRRKGKQWERCLNEYIKLPEVVRVFRLAEVGDVPKLIPCSTFPGRLEVYRQTLSKTPPHKIHKVKLATAGYWYAKVSHKGQATVEVPINIPDAVAKLAPSPQVSLCRTRSSGNPSRSFTWNNLLAVAKEMDEKLEQAEYEKENYYSRLKGVGIKIYDASIDDFRLEDPDKEINLERLVHIVGLLNVGKSTLLEVLIYFFAEQGYRCALLVNDVAAAVRLASLFRDGLDVLAAPVLGNNRSQHLSKVYEPILLSKGEEIEKGAVHSAWRWFSPVCPLLALVQSEDKWDFGEEPCHQLYKKQAVSTQKFSSNFNIDDDEEIEDLEYNDVNKITCPFYYNCPRHQLERDLATANVWILTPASFIHTRVPRQVFALRLTFAEAVYRECDFLFVDEADRVQVQFDEAGAPDEVLVDASGNSLLNKLGLKFATAIYNSDRRNMSAELVAVAKRANDYAQIAADLILPRLYNQPKLVEWIGHHPFTGRSLFSHIIRDILEPLDDNDVPLQKRGKQRRSRVESAPPEQARLRRKKIMQPLEKFLQAPLNQKQGGELSDLAFNILSADDGRALTSVADWLEKWLVSEDIPIPEKAKFDELTNHVHFAILITVLNDRLNFLVENLNALMRVKVLDMHDTSLALVYRPPHDYLPVVPSSPVGNILGFRYTRGRGYTSGKLEYFRYVGVGRYLLLNFPKLFAADNWDGPHTVLISGTSYAPGTPAYHIQERPMILLEPASHNNTAGDAGIGESAFHFSPKRYLEGEYIAVSGLPPANRKKAVDDMVKAIALSNKQTKSFLTQLFDTLEELQQQDPKRWHDRQRLLIITNSYVESEFAQSVLKPLYHVEHIDSIVTLRRDNAPSSSNSMARSKIRDTAKLPIQIVIAPLMALERGHNILNEKRIAAFGAAIFLSRPMPVPDDWQTTVQQLNNWALQKFADLSVYEKLQGNLNLTNVEQEFYYHAALKMLDLNCRAMSFKQLTPDERSVLCWSQLVSIWQIIGRLVRGGVPCIVHFLDAKFAPLSAKGEVDTEVTSLLVGIIKELEVAIDASGKKPWEATIASSLYGAFFNALSKMKDNGFYYGN
ncbi:hypothetical protein RIVM261_077290 [Rivularia sp. IAM M-261]|nr:hypothetical protein RIVM261_077290 [Rivularia sp. IAM M-261]